MSQNYEKLKPLLRELAKVIVGMDRSRPRLPTCSPGWRARRPSVQLLPPRLLRGRTWQREGRRGQGPPVHPSTSSGRTDEDMRRSVQLCTINGRVPRLSRACQRVRYKSEQSYVWLKRTPPLPPIESIRHKDNCANIPTEGVTSWPMKDSRMNLFLREMAVEFSSCEADNISVIVSVHPPSREEDNL